MAMTAFDTIHADVVRQFDDQLGVVIARRRLAAALGEGRGALRIVDVGDDPAQRRVSSALPARKFGTSMERNTSITSAAMAR